MAYGYARGRGRYAAVPISASAKRLRDPDSPAPCCCWVEITAPIVSSRRPRRQNSAADPDRRVFDVAKPGKCQAPQLVRVITPVTYYGVISAKWTRSRIARFPIAPDDLLASNAKS